MHAYLVVVADAARARLFGRKKKFSDLEEIEVLTHPESRLRRQDLVSDRAGTVHEARDFGESAAEQQTDPKDREAIRFARQVCARLEHLSSKNKPDEIALIAEPRFLGLLRQHLSKDVRKHVTVEISANMTRESSETIARKLEA